MCNRCRPRSQEGRNIGTATPPVRRGIRRGNGLGSEIDWNELSPEECEDLITALLTELYRAGDGFGAVVGMAAATTRSQ